MQNLITKTFLPIGSKVFYLTLIDGSYQIGRGEIHEVKIESSSHLVVYYIRDSHPSKVMHEPIPIMESLVTPPDLSLMKQIVHSIINCQSLSREDALAILNLHYNLLMEEPC